MGTLVVEPFPHSIHQCFNVFDVIFRRYKEDVRCGFSKASHPFFRVNFGDRIVLRSPSYNELDPPLFKVFPGLDIFSLKIETA